MPRNPAVTAFIQALDHPLKAEIEAVREIMLGIDPGISDLIKWNSVSFRAADDFATIHLRSTRQIQMIFHTGVKVKDAPKPSIDDPAGLVKWLAKDRCQITLGAGDEIEANRLHFEALVRTWVAQLQPAG